jgi:hypothetical protein
MSTTQFHYTSKALSAICDERENQLDTWGVQDLSPLELLSILGEEYGEACQAALAYARPDLHDPSGKYDLPPETLRARYRRELVQVAAVAVQAIECLDRTEPQR